MYASFYIPKGTIYMCGSCSTAIERQANKKVIWII